MLRTLDVKFDNWLWDQEQKWPDLPWYIQLLILMFGDKDSKKKGINNDLSDMQKESEDGGKPEKV